MWPCFQSWFPYKRPPNSIWDSFVWDSFESEWMPNIRYSCFQKRAMWRPDVCNDRGIHRSPKCMDKAFVHNNVLSFNAGLLKVTQDRVQREGHKIQIVTQTRNVGALYYLCSFLPPTIIFRKRSFRARESVITMTSRFVQTYEQQPQVSLQTVPYVRILLSFMSKRMGCDECHAPFICNSECFWAERWNHFLVFFAQFFTFQELARMDFHRCYTRKRKRRDGVIYEALCRVSWSTISVAHIWIVKVMIYKIAWVHINTKNSVTRLR